MQTRTDVHYWMHTTLLRLYDIDRYLASFVDPQPFRRLQRQWGAVISGLHALSFLTRESHQQDSLDVYLSWAGLFDIGAFLLLEGYRCVKDDFPRIVQAVHFLVASNTPCRSSYDVVALVRFRRQDRTVTLMVAALSPIRCILRHDISEL